MRREEPKKMIAIEDTNFMHFGRNLAGNPARDSRGDTRRKVLIAIPDNMVGELMDMGLNVKEWVDREDETKRTHFVQAALSYRDSHGNAMKYPPKVYLVNKDGVAVPLPEEAINDEFDFMPVKNINVILNPWEYQPGKWSLYIRTLYVEQDYERIQFLEERERELDPFGERYKRG